MPIDLLFDSVAVRLRSEDVGGLAATINFSFTDLDEAWVLGMSNRALHALHRHDRDADVTVTLTKPTLLQIVGGETTFADAIAAGDVEAVGDTGAIGRIFDHLDTFMTNFAIVEP
jgi:alkyl sulfatase BDS1-like metallo-beta-lactamase superfamily hydrolase